MRKKSLFIFSFVIITASVQAQELQARLTILTNQLSSQTNKNIFQTLQNGLTNFLNNRKWTNDAFQPNEKIQCNFLLNVDQDMGNNVFRAKLTIQAARPVYNTSYDSPLMNYMD